MTRLRTLTAAGAVLIGLALTLAWWADRTPDPAPPTARPHAKRPDLVVKRSSSRDPAPTERPTRAERDDREPKTTEASPSRTLVLADIVDEQGRPADGAWIVPVDCPGWSYSGVEGEYLADPGRCVLRAARKDGMLTARGPLATLELPPASSTYDPVYVQLVLSEQRTGGIGIRFHPADNGMQVTQISPGTPAEAAGLKPGDVIVAIGGEEIAGIGSEEFVERMTGGVGTDVEFTVRIESDTGIAEETVRVVRAFLDI